MIKYLVKAWQIFCYPLIKILVVIILRNKRIDPQLGEKQPGIRYVVVSNHQGAIDSFVIGYGIPFSVLINYLPMTFLVKNRFYSNNLLRPFLYMFGCFRASRTKGKPSGLEESKRRMGLGFTVNIFPEGRVSNLDRRFKPKKGIEVLAGLPQTQLIPARVKWQRRSGLVKSYSLAVGKPFDGKNMTAEQIMDVVYGLKFR